MDSSNKYLTVDTINQNLKHVDFPWISPIVSRGNEIEEEIKKGKKFPFKEVFHLWSGDPQGMGQKPMTFFQQVVSLCLYPAFLQSPSFPSDAKLRAMTIIKNCVGRRTGSYSECPGQQFIREQVAEFIQNRDGVPASYEDIILENGATDAIRVVLSLFKNNAATKPPGVMIPVPQYPLFSATVTEYGMYQINYYLNEEKQWTVDVEELQRAINLSKPYCEPKILVIINPGNPVGSVMTQNDMQNIIKFAYEEKLLILADEVYQYNVYDSDSKFYSFKKVMKEMGLPYSNMQLASFMSASKGYMAECGSRCGYCEIVNLDKDVKDILMKLHCVRLSANIHGQIIMYCITNPPGPDEPSYELFEQEKSSILQSLKQGAQYCYEKLNSVEGLSCSKIAGSIYAFPKIELSKKALAEAQRRKQSPDEFYAMELVETAGISVLPGYFFGQRPETYHFRLTIPPQMDKLKIIIQRILEFHLYFLEKYKD